MGRSHALSGAGIWLVGSAVYSATVTHEPNNIPTLILGTIVFTGAALAPDIDSYSATVTKSFGIFGRVLYFLANVVSLFFYNITRSRYDEPKTNGHRTFFHTTIAAIVMGGLVALATLSTGEVTIWDKVYSWGQVFALLIMAFCLHLALAGVFSKQLKNSKKGFGPYILMAASIGIMLIISRVLPAPEGTYAWLGLAFGLGWYTHLLGDFITKMGVPLLWPIPISGHRWWDVSLPTFMRIEAGGTVENVFLVPLFLLMIAGGAVWNVLIIMGVTS